MLSRSRTLLISCLLLPALASAAEPIDPAVINAGPPAKASPATAGWGYWPKAPAAWLQTFQGQLGRTKQGDVGVVFLGDSITQGWGAAGKAEWEAQYAPMKAVNFGIGGDSTRQVLWRLEHGLVDGLTPKLVVLCIGTNNLYGDNNSGTDAEIADGVKQVITEVRAKLPTAKILVLGMLPRENAYFCDRIARINALVAPVADGANVRWLDAGASFLASPGTVKAELYRDDKVHLTTAGYTVWNAAIQPIVAELTK